MVFRRKKSSSGTSASVPRPRGREGAGNGPAGPVSGAENPLARRFRLDEEPDTIDLERADGFRDTSDQEQDVPTTRILSGDDEEAALAENRALKDPVSGFLAVISGPGRGSIQSGVMFHRQLHWITGTAGYPARTIALLPTILKPESFICNRAKGTSLLILKASPCWRPHNWLRVTKSAWVTPCCASCPCAAKTSTGRKRANWQGP